MSDTRLVRGRRVGQRAVAGNRRLGGEQAWIIIGDQEMHRLPGLVATRLWDKPFDDQVVDPRVFGRAARARGKYTGVHIQPSVIRYLSAGDETVVGEGNQTARTHFHRGVDELILLKFRRAVSGATTDWDKRQSRAVPTGFDAHFGGGVIVGGQRAVIERIDGHAQPRAGTFFGRETPVELDFSQVAKL